MKPRFRAAFDDDRLLASPQRDAGGLWRRRQRPSDLAERTVHDRGAGARLGSGEGVPRVEAVERVVGPGMLSFR